jgi:predicted metal-dependent hydrolase
MKKIIPRVMNFSFKKTIPRYWNNGNPFSTHLLNSFTLLFPAGEKFFIKSINRYRMQIKDPKLKNDVKDFIRQETQHSIEHEKFFNNLADQGYSLDLMLKSLEVLLKILDKHSPDKFNLALTSALEHITALLAEITLETNFLENAEQSMKELFEWHAREEIEHRHVAYDVLNEIDDSYTLRVAGLIGAYIIMGSYSSAFTANLLLQDNKLFNSPVLKECFELLLTKEKLFFKGCAIFFRYINPDFHPLENQDVDELVAQFFSDQVELGVA